MQRVGSSLRKLSFTSSYVLEHLKNRSLLRLSGDDAAILLQGLITNDMQHLSHGAGSMFALFLNSKGRVLYDTIIYRPTSDNIYYVEIDEQASNIVKKHLNIYRLRKKVDISVVDDQFKIWVQYNPTSLASTQKSSKNESKVIEEQIISREQSDKNVITKSLGNKEILIFRDPRLSILGSRIIAPADCDNKIAELFTGTSGPSFKWFRYKLGIGEGVEELPPGNCFPLEANCDYLHGISFQKGCYIGQELTARTQHTGVVRKRLMPLNLETSFKNEPEKDAVIKAGEFNVGKLRGFEEDSALGLLRIVQALEADKLVVNNIIATTNKPSWWPQEISKEKLSSNKL